MIHPGDTRRQVEGLRAHLGADPARAREIVKERIALGHESRLYGLRDHARRTPRHEIDLAGRERIDRALEQGRGAILWVGRFVFASLIAKMALHEAGIPVSHLSRPAHGFASSEFAIRRLNPIWTRVEERYLRERIVMDPARPATALRRLHARLTENEVVSISVGDEGVRTTPVSLPIPGGDTAAEGRPIELATGPITLAASTGAALIPVFAVREPTRRFRVEIQEPLDVPDLDRVAREDVVARAYGERLAPFVVCYPGQWIP